MVESFSGSARAAPSMFSKATGGPRRGNSALEALDSEMEWERGRLAVLASPLTPVDIRLTDVEDRPCLVLRNNKVECCFEDASGDREEGGGRI